jgi:succinoglycan biosynthesis transport protein ExoP
MQDEKRVPTRLTVPSRPAREIDAYVAGGVAGAAEPPAMNVFGAVWRRKGIVLACLILGVAAGSVYYMRAAPVYSASSVVYVQQEKSKMLVDEFESATASVGYLYTQCQLMTSTAILSKALEVPGVADAKMLRGVENPVGYLKSVLSAMPTKQGELIVITMEAPNPQDAATIVNGVVQAYIDYQNLQHQSNAVQVASILQKELDSHEAELKSDQDQMLQLKRANPDLGLRSDKGGLTAERLLQLNTALGDAEMRAEDLRAALASATAADPGDFTTLRGLVDQCKLGDDLPPSNLPQLSMILEQQKLRLNDALDGHYGQASDQVQRAQTAVDRAGADLATATRQAAAACLNTIRIASAAADNRVKQYQTAISAERSLNQGLNSEEAQYEQLNLEAQRTERALDVLDERLKNVKGIEDVSPMTISVLETGKPNPFPVRPTAPKVLGLATIAGLLAGVGAALLSDRLDQRLRSVEEIGVLLEATILGVVPRILRRTVPGEAGREIALRPRSGVAEAFRTIRTAIYFGGDERAVKTILITSPTPGDGKSTCISNLAIAVAQAGRRVLLIDADCRRPVQHKTFKVEETPGLTGVLTGQCKLVDAIRPTGIDRLDLLQCGPLPHNPAELLDSQALLDLLGEAGRRYDQVLIDSPPVTLVSDARVLAASCDASVLVLRAERSTRRGATLAWNALGSVGANLLGVVFNDLSRQKDGYGYAYYGYGRYGYAPAAPELKGPLAANGIGNGVGSGLANGIANGAGNGKSSTTVTE